MAHYAFLDENNVVIEIISGKDENDDPNIDWEEFYGNFRGLTCKRTSYNTHLGEHLNGKQPFRKNYAAIGGTYDFDRDAFIPVQTYKGWIIDEDTCDWVPPIPHPNDGKAYIWNEDLEDWEIDPYVA